MEIPHIQWIEQIGTSEFDTSYGITTDSNGNVYITGGTDGSLAGVNKGYVDAWIAKYNTHGNLVWSKQIGTSELDVSDSVTTDSNGNVYITGWTHGILGGVNQGFSDAWIAKYNTHGNLVWSNQIGTSEWDFYNGVTTDSNS